MQEKQEQLVLDYIRKQKGRVSLYWALENRLRSAAICRLEKAGKIRSNMTTEFPFNFWMITE